MVIYGVAILALCTVVGAALGLLALAAALLRRLLVDLDVEASAQQARRRREPAETCTHRDLLMQM